MKRKGGQKDYAGIEAVGREGGNRGLPSLRGGSLGGVGIVLLQNAFPYCRGEKEVLRPWRDRKGGEDKRESEGKGIGNGNRLTQQTTGRKIISSKGRETGLRKT